ncbi:amino acid ABC transporter ATP-binding protein [Streptomyces sp. NBC_00243]|uniref:amino acid ABC transporter ATP-binding protein n=1 Tax=Streptomyces sp. NBC_00243 TaxID=2975688 RepID=UPI002DDA6F07|nr:amino acid ABC transporter ATP-binding protein [Streptomyces sp. NBC_00243]WRZ18863.1 amino acid ABC transporter ATP-binding protein [Streptomyces sp. NBC_00243]
MSADAETRPVVQAHDVHKSFGALEVLKGIDLTVERGEVVCLLGASGSGKSTFLRCINHLETVDRGYILVDGRLVGSDLVRGRLHEAHPSAVAERKSRIGMVFQQFNLFPHMTVLENVILAPMRVKKESRDVAVERGGRLLQRVGLGDKRDAYPSHLSGGQQQRVAIARALAMEPELMLFDEPTSALDPELVGEVLDVMRDLAASGMTMIVVTHEMGFARQVADTAVFLSEGRIIEQGPPDQVIGAPTHERTRSFLGKVL